MIFKMQFDYLTQFSDERYLDHEVKSFCYLLLVFFFNLITHFTESIMLKPLLNHTKQYLSQVLNLNNATAVKHFLNLYPPYLGAGVRVQEIDYQKGFITVKMPLTPLNKNIVGTQFGGSLYSMTDPFFMVLLMQKLGDAYVVWDKAASIDFVKAGHGTVSATFHIDDNEIEQIKNLAQEGKPVFRTYHVDIHNDADEVIAHVEKTLYIRLRQFSKSANIERRF